MQLCIDVRRILEEQASIRMPRGIWLGNICPALGSTDRVYTRISNISGRTALPSRDFDLISF